VAFLFDLSRGERQVGSQQGRRLKWKKPVLASSGFVLFVLALGLMKEGAGGLAPLLRGRLEITNTADSMGFGWLMSYLILSGSPVAAAAVALLSADALSPLQVFTAVIRHGLVLDEIVAEAQEGQYDLLVTGAHITPGLNARLVDDLSADILLAANRPVLIVRQEQ